MFQPGQRERVSPPTTPQSPPRVINFVRPPAGAFNHAVLPHDVPEGARPMPTAVAPARGAAAVLPSPGPRSSRRGSPGGYAPLAYPDTAYELPSFRAAASGCDPAARYGAPLAGTLVRTAPPGKRARCRRGHAPPAEVLGALSHLTGTVHAPPLGFVPDSPCKLGHLSGTAPFPGRRGDREGRHPRPRAAMVLSSRRSVFRILARRGSRTRRAGSETRR